MFDPETFVHEQTTEADSTEYEPVPEDDLYTAVVAGSPKARVTRDGSAVMDIDWRLDAPDIPQAHERLARQGIWLDLTATGGLDRAKGKNVALGLLREAVGQNNPGEPWSPSMLEGAAAKVKVSNRIYDGKLFLDVKSVTRI